MSVPLPDRGPRRPRQGPCRRCWGTVFWVPTEAKAGARVMPVDIDPTPDGLCFLIPAGDGSTGLWVRVIGHHQPVPPELAELPRYTSHIWSCPFSDRAQRTGPTGR